jgi:hypothetical protein
MPVLLTVYGSPTNFSVLYAGPKQFFPFTIRTQTNFFVQYEGPKHFFLCCTEVRHKFFRVVRGQNHRGFDLIREKTDQRQSTKAKKPTSTEALTRFFLLRGESNTCSTNICSIYMSHTT